MSALPIAEDGNQKEQWRWVVGFEGTYQISSQARVRSVDRDVVQQGYTRRLSGKLLSPTSSIYPHVMLRQQRRQRTVRLHTLVAEAFIGPRPFAGAEVLHGDGNPKNNRVENLRWDTRSENEHDKVRHGTHHQSKKTHCKRKHEFTPENTRVQSRPDSTGQMVDRRSCKTCARTVYSTRRAA